MHFHGSFTQIQDATQVLTFSGQDGVFSAVIMEVELF